MIIFIDDNGSGGQSIDSRIVVHTLIVEPFFFAHLLFEFESCDSIAAGI